MAALSVNESLNFTELKELLEVTDGNLASHTLALEKKDMIEVNKSFQNRKPNTSYSATEYGKKAFAEHLNALEKLIGTQNK